MFQRSTLAKEELTCCLKRRIGNEVDVCSVLTEHNHRYGQIVPKHGYLTDGGRLVLKNVQAFLSALAEAEVEPEFCFDDLGDVEKVLDELEESDVDVSDDLMLGSDVVLQGAAPKHNSHLMQVFQSFQDNESSAEMVSPAHLDNAKRKEWHEMAEKFGMMSKSHGEGSRRVVVVTKKGAKSQTVFSKGNNNNEAPSDRDWKDSYYRKRFNDRGLDDQFRLAKLSFDFFFCLAHR